MNIKEQIVEFLKKKYESRSEADYSETAGRLIDLVLNALTIEKEYYGNQPDRDGLEDCYVGGWNSCVDAYEELKTKLRM